MLLITCNRTSVGLASAVAATELGIPIERCTGAPDCLDHHVRESDAVLILTNSRPSRLSSKVMRAVFENGKPCLSVAIAWTSRNAEAVQKWLTGKHVQKLFVTGYVDRAGAVSFLRTALAT